MSVPLLRGNVYWCDLGFGEKPWLVVSNNGRNQALRSALVARMTTTPKQPLASIVALDQVDEPLVGSVLCDDIETIYESDDVFRHAGALAPATMLKVAESLKVAFGLR